MTEPDESIEMLGGGDVEPDHGPTADAYGWMGPEDDPDRASRWRDGEEAVRADDDRDEGTENDEPR
jgi:hypothetical protein